MGLEYKDNSQEVEKVSWEVTTQSPPSPARETGGVLDCIRDSLASVQEGQNEIRSQLNEIRAQLNDINQMMKAMYEWHLSHGSPPPPPSSSQ